MKYHCTLTVDVHPKYGKHVGRLFDAFVQGLPAQIGGLTIEDSQHGAPVPPKNARQPRSGSGKQSGPRPSSLGADA